MPQDRYHVTDHQDGKLQQGAGVLNSRVPSKTPFTHYVNLLCSVPSSYAK